jgi:hypothetical protein
MVSLAGFVCLYLRAGRAWLMWSFVGLRMVALALNFLTGQNLNYVEITALQQVHDRKKLSNDVREVLGKALTH